MQTWKEMEREQNRRTLLVVTVLLLVMSAVFRLGIYRAHEAEQTLKTLALQATIQESVIPRLGTVIQPLVPYADGFMRTTVAMPFHDPSKGRVVVEGYTVFFPVGATPKINDRLWCKPADDYWIATCTNSWGIGITTGK